MEGLSLVRPSHEYKEQALEYINEFIEYGSQINGTGSLDKYLDNYEEWLDKVDFNREMTPGSVLRRVPAETFMLIRDTDNKLIGMIDIRLMLNEYLLNYGGHIGYSIRPSERRCGYAMYQLYLGLNYCLEKGIDKVLITCDKDNIGSAKTIINCGGILENEILEDDGNLLQRYWIDVLDSIKKLSKKYNR